MKKLTRVKKIIIFSLLTAVLIVVGAWGANYFSGGELANKVSAFELDLGQSRQSTSTQKETEEMYKKGDPNLVEMKEQPKKTTTSSSSAPASSSAQPAPQSSESSAPPASPATESSAPPAPAPPAAPAYAPLTIYVSGVAIPYQNGGYTNGQAIIDANPNGTASTWGGVTPFSGSDGMNTHFIGHHWGAFDPFISLPQGGQVTVTDGNGTPYNYVVNSINVTDVNGNDVTTGRSLFSEITSTGGGERCVFQTCLSETQRRILFCQPG